MKKGVAALTLAGSDPSGGAGIQQDLETFRHCQVQGLSVTTVVTAQTSKKFLSLYALPKKVISMQMNLLFEEYAIPAAKTGLLYKKDIVELILLKFKKLPTTKLVVDPIMKATLGRSLLQLKALDSLKKLIGKAYVVTPNLDEASILSGSSINDLEEMKTAAKNIYALGPKYVIIKGGHLAGDPIDLLYDGNDFVSFAKKRINSSKFHGLGCRFSAALTAYLTQDHPIYEAFELAESFMIKTLGDII